MEDLLQVILNKDKKNTAQRTNMSIPANFKKSIY